MKRIVFLLMLMATPLMAVQPDEILDDPALEDRARALSAELRCLVCRNESIDESNADLARDLRLLVRERLVAGDSDAEVMDFVVARYGEYVLLSPQKSGSTLILWLAGPALLGLALLIAATFLRQRRGTDGVEDLSAEEKARLARLLEDDAG